MCVNWSLELSKATILQGTFDSDSVGSFHKGWTMVSANLALKSSTFLVAPFIKISDDHFTYVGSLFVLSFCFVSSRVTLSIMEKSIFGADEVVSHAGRLYGQGIDP